MRARERIKYACKVRGVHGLVLVVLALLGLDAVVLAYFKPHALSAGLPAVLLITQIFAVSVGYKGAAEAGHLDPLLLSDRRRWATGGLLFLAAFVPGFAVWIVVGLGQWLTLGWRQASCLHLPGLSALVFVSSVAWVANLGLPRYTSAVVWVLVMAATPMLTADSFSALIDVLARSPQELHRHLLGALAMGVSEPFSITSIPWPHGIEALFLLTGLLVLVGGLAYIERKGVPLAS